jgi:RNA polymerase sigma-70 factor, ECF subfamily
MFGHMDDWQLLEAWRDGDGASGEALVRRHMAMLTRFFRNKVGNPEDVADLISDTMLACTRSKEHVRKTEAFRSFMFATATNMLRRHYRKKAKREREVGDFAELCAGDSDDPRSLASLVSLKEESRLLVRALRRVPLEQQIVLELIYIESLTGAEIAELLEVPLPTVYTRLRRGREKLRAMVVELAQSGELATSTITGLGKWAARIREEISR